MCCFGRRSVSSIVASKLSEMDYILLLIFKLLFNFVLIISTLPRKKLFFDYFCLFGKWFRSYFRFSSSSS